MTVLSARDLKVGAILRGVTLDLEPGQVLGLVAPNGAGKSTLLATLSGALRADEGAIRRPEGLAWMPEGGPQDPGVSGRRWLNIGRRLPGWQEEEARRLLDALPVPLDRAVEALSLGERTRLGLTLTLARAAPLYLLDDPFLGLDPAARAEARRAISRRITPDNAMILATPDLGSVARLATHLATLEGGRLRALGEIEGGAAALERALGAAAEAR